jgi:hypothetical protein
MFLSTLLSIIVYTLPLCNCFVISNEHRISTCLPLPAHEDGEHPKREPPGSVGRLACCYKRLNTSQPENMYNLPANNVAEALDNILKAQLTEGEEFVSEESFIACLDGWMVAYNKNQRNPIYIERMVQVLDRIEESSPLLEITFDPYATVTHAWLSCQQASCALTVLARMESNPHVVKAADSAKVVQYNKILKGLANGKDIDIALELIHCMCQGSIMEWEAYDFVPSVKPNSNSFVPFLKILSIENDEKELLTLMREAQKLCVLEGFLHQKLQRFLKDEVEMSKFMNKL